MTPHERLAQLVEKAKLVTTPMTIAERVEQKSYIDRIEKEAEEFVDSCRDDGNTVEEALSKHLMACYMNWQFASDAQDQAVNPAAIQDLAVEVEKLIEALRLITDLGEQIWDAAGVVVSAGGVSGVMKRHLEPQINRLPQRIKEARAALAQWKGKR